MSYLRPEHFLGIESEGRHEDYYPLLGHFLTQVYTLDVSVGGLSYALKFGELPEELRPLLQAGEVHGILGTELFRHFAVNLSLKEKVLCLELPHSMAGLAG